LPNKTWFSLGIAIGCEEFLVMMENNGTKKPDFLITGAQKSGTTWLWDVLKDHPDTDLPQQKEIQFFSSTERYNKGLPWYYDHFKDLDINKIIGEASTDYFYDKVLINNMKVDHSLPSIADLISRNLPDVKIIVSLRDPVRRAVSAYFHHLQHRRFPPSMTILDADRAYPNLRIIERGYYSRFITAWRKHFDESSLHWIIFEDDICSSPTTTIQELYSFLNISVDHVPNALSRASNKRWGWTHIWLNYYLGPWYGYLYRVLQRILPDGYWEHFNNLELVQEKEIKSKELQDLRVVYRPEKEQTEKLLQRRLSSWTLDL
jgi:hypothetical protein